MKAEQRVVDRASGIEDVVAAERDVLQYVPVEHRARVSELLGYMRGAAYRAVVDDACSDSATDFAIGAAVGSILTIIYLRFF